MKIRNMIWRAVLVNNASKSVKLVTQDNIATMVFNETVDSNFGNSDIKEWLNDASASGFLSRLNNYPNFIVTDSEPDIENLIHYGYQYLAHFKVPRRYIRVAQLPTNASGKIKHYLLRQRVNKK